MRCLSLLLKVIALNLGALDKFRENKNCIQYPVISDFLVMTQDTHTTTPEDLSQHSPHFHMLPILDNLKYLKYDLFFHASPRLLPPLLEVCIVSFYVSIMVILN